MGLLLSLLTSVSIRSTQLRHELNIVSLFYRGDLPGIQFIGAVPVVVRRVYPLWDRPSFVVFHPEPGVGPREVPDDEGSAWCEQATDGDVHLIGDVRGRNQVPAAPGGSGLACHNLYGDAQGGLSLSWRRVSPKNSRGYSPRLKNRSQGIRKLLTHLNR